jgi:hypothetical protein
MKKLLIILLLSPLFCIGQNVSFIVSGDTLFASNPSTGERRQLTKTIPTQVGQSGKVLGTNGSVFVWQDPPTAGAHNHPIGEVTGLQAALDGKADVSHAHAIGEVTGLQAALDAKAPLANPTFTGTVSGITKAMVGLANVDNTADADKPVSTATQTALNLKQTVPTSGLGLGGSVSQAGNKGTAVTLNKQYGRITMVNSALAAAAEISFTVNNSTVSATDVVIVNMQSVGTAAAYLISVGAVSNGSFVITVSNASAGSLSQAIVLNFCVIKSVID